MKIKFTIFLSLLFMLNVVVKAQDTLFIGGDSPVNTTIVSEIANNPDKVYVLKRGVRYYLNGVIESGDWHLRIIGETEPADLPPAIIQPKVDEGANAPDYGIVAESDVTIKNIYFLNEPYGGREARGAMNTKGSKKRIEVDNCIFDYGFHIAIRNDGSLSSYFVTNSVFKNIAFWNNISNGKGFSIRQVEIGLDSIVFENCTFTNMNNLMSGWGSSVKYYKFNHNTVFNLMKLPNEVSEHCVEMEVSNNIFYNVGVIGHYDNPAGGFHGLVSYPGVTDTVDLKMGWFRILEDLRPDTIFAEDGTIEYLFAEQNRKINWTNNSVFFGDKLVNFWDTSVDAQPQPFMNDTVASWIAKDDNYVVEDPLSINPNFTILPNSIDSLIKKCQQAAEGVQPQADIYYMATDPNGAVHWPLEFDFSYPETSSLFSYATDGGPIGDRRWFPDYGTGLNDHKKSKYNLSQNYPNPFNSITNIEYTLDQVEYVKLTILNVHGQVVTVLIDNSKQMTGSHSVNFDAQNLPSGAYFYRFEVGDYVEVRKMMKN